MLEAAASFPTGVPGLDRVLGGGLSHPCLVSIVGVPGAGKTVLASQILFHAARQGLSVAVFTSRSEGSEQYLAHLAGFTFFDPALLGNTVRLYTLAGHLSDPSVSPIAAIAATIRRTEAKLVLLDGFHGAEELLSDSQNTPDILSALATQVRYLGATLLVTQADEVRNPALHRDLIASDVIIGLDYGVRERRHQRLLDVVKHRGSAQWAGLHSYQIDSGGLRVFPRLVSYPTPPSRPARQTRAPFGLAALDRLLGGGLPDGATLLAGTPGAGKTTLGLVWAMAEASPEAQTLFVTFGEQTDQLVQKAAVFGMDLAEERRRGAVTVLRIPPTDLNPDAVAAMILAAVSSGQVARLVIDELALLLEDLADDGRAYLVALNQQLYGSGVTSLYLLEIPRGNVLDVQLSHIPVSVVADTVMAIQRDEWGGKMRNQLAALRMRQSTFDPTRHELVLEDGKVLVRPLG
ncbi:MAG TPA: ATPase domain-containing protein [Roseiflexaceae bacterium]|nr:ATPase domain-containing protein [Roseiflexaceae bacterium]